MDSRPLQQGEIPGAGMGISEEQPRKSGNLVELGRGWMIAARGPRKGRAGSFLGFGPSSLCSAARSPRSGGGEGRQELRCSVGATDALCGGFSQPRGLPPGPPPPPSAPPHPRLGCSGRSSRGALGRAGRTRGDRASSGGAPPPPRPLPGPGPARLLRPLSARWLALGGSRCSRAPRSAAAPPPTPPPASPGDRAP